MEAAAPPLVKPPLVAIALLSSAGLALEILLMRLFAIVHWHHFAYMVLSVALLGFGASGTVLSFLRSHGQALFATLFLANAALFAASALAAFPIAAHVPFNALEVLWDPAQWRWLALVYLCLALPFFFLANAVALTLRQYEGAIARVYGADLVGAGAGAVAIVVCLDTFPPEWGLRAIAALAFAGVAWGAPMLGVRERRIWIGGAALAIVACFTVDPGWPSITITPYKGLPQALRIPGATVVNEKSSATALTTVVRNQQVPLRQAPGLSLGNAAALPPQLAVFEDGDGPSAITRYDGDRETLVYLDFLTSALPYALLQAPRVLVAGAHGDTILQAVVAGARRVDVVEPQAAKRALLDHDHAAWFGWKYVEPVVRMSGRDIRSHLAADRVRYDLIVFPLAESSGAGGVRGLTEDFLRTHQAMSLYWKRLEPEGLVAFTSWVQLPPREEPKLVLMLTRVMRDADIADPARHFVLVRSLQTTTLVWSRAPFSSNRFDAARRFAATRGFDVDHPPAPKTRTFHSLPEPFYTQAVAALAASDPKEIARYQSQHPFDVTTPTDEAPYFFQFFRWRTVEQALALKPVGGLALLEWGYPVLVLTLLQATVASIALIAAPLLLRRTRLPAGATVLGYFALVGFAFMFLEIAYLQRFTLFLGHPIHAAATVLGGFLVGAGIGSLYAARLARRHPPERLLRIAAVIAAAVALVELAGMGPLFTTLAALVPVAQPTIELGVRVTIAVVLILPLAIALGFPFPLGLGLAAARGDGALAWAWAINGCASVIGAVLATLVAVHAGSSAVVVVAAFAYVAAAALAGRLSGMPRGGT